MKAITRSKYGGPEVLGVSETAKPLVKPNQILVKVYANGLNAADWHIMRGKPHFMRLIFGLFKPKKKHFGSDFAGLVEAVGSEVSDFEIGDPIYGEALGAFAEYFAVSPKVCAKFEKGLDFKTMAAVPIAGLTAYQALTQYGKIKKGEKVLINGASGGVGHFMVQLSKYLGAHVTAVCSKKNKTFVESLGADKVLPYDMTPLENHQDTYDILIDNHGNINYADYKRLANRGVMVGFTTMAHMIKLSFLAFVKRYPFTSFTASPNRSDLETLAQLVHQGDLKVAIQKVYPYHEISEAMDYLEQMKTQGKLVVEWV